MYKLILLCLVFSNVYLFIQISREKQRNRVLQAFVGGIFEYVQKSLYAVEILGNEQKAKQEGYLEHFRDVLLDGVSAWLHSDFWQKPYRKWLANGKDLFHDEKYSNGGFNQLYLDLYKRELKQTIEAAKSERP